MFKIGDKIVCVDANFCNDKSGVRPINETDIYHFDGYYKDTTFIYLREMPDINPHGERIAYNSRVFRKLDDNFSTSVLENITEQIKEDHLQLA